MCGGICTATATAPASSSTSPSTAWSTRQATAWAEDPQRLRQLASVVWATADELGEARARQATPRGWHRVKDLEWVQDLGDLLKVAQVRARALGDQQIPLLRRTIVIYIT